MAEAEYAGTVVSCPACNTKIEVPAAPAEPAAAAGQPKLKSGEPLRKAWKEEDPSNPNAKLSLGIGLGAALLWFAIVYPMQAPAGKDMAYFTGPEFLANLFYKHFAVSFANTLFFCWAMAILFLKLRKLGHQRQALLLDVLPAELGKEINAQNVGKFIDQLYRLPVKLRDSLMVNRIRKALEFFEVRQNVSDVSALMTSQSTVDGSRIVGSYIMVRAFLWAIPLLGFIGTVVGLSHALGGMSFSDTDVDKMMGSVSAVVSGLGTAFDATLLGLVLAVTLNFPLNSIAKREDEMLNDIDAFCNEVLLPRLNDGGAPTGKDLGGVADSVVKALSRAQEEFLTDLNTLSARMLEHANHLDERAERHHQTVADEFKTSMAKMREAIGEQQNTVSQEFSKNVASLRSNLEEQQQKVTKTALEEMSKVFDNVAKTGADVNGALKESVRLTSIYVSGLEQGINGINTALSNLGEKQIVVQRVKSKWWFGKG